MILKSLSLKNFGPYAGTCVIDLSPTPGPVDRPICLIGALNGSGKTSLLDGIVLALYGPRARCSTRADQSWKDFLYKARNSSTPVEEKSEVSLTFDYPTADGTTTYRLVRAWWLPNTGVGESLQVFVKPPGGGERLDSELTETWAERVEDLVPLGVSNLFFFDGELVRALATSDHTTPEVRGAIRTLLGLELPDRLSKDLTIIVNRKRKELGDEEDLREADKLERRHAALLEEKGSLALDRGEVLVQVEQAKRELARLREHFVASGGELAEKRTQTEQLHGRAQARIDGARATLRELAAGALPLALVQPLLERTVARAKAEVKHIEAYDLGALLEQRDQETLSALRGLRFERDKIQMVADLLATDRDRRAVPLKGEPYLNMHRNTVVAMAQVLDQQIPQQRAAAERALAELASARQEADRLQGQLSAAAAPEEVSGQVKRLERASAKVSELEAEHRRLTDRIAALEAESARVGVELDRKLRAVAETRQAEMASRRMVGAAERVQEVLTAYQDRLKKKKLDELEELVTERFRHLSRKDDLVQRIEIDAETFRLSLYGQGRRPVDKARLSAGEQQILAVAFLWALSIASGRNLPVVIDTPLSRMDSAHRQNLVERYFPHASHQVVLLSTDSEIDRGYYEQLKALDVVDRTYLLEFDSAAKTSRIRPGYFWE